MKDHELATTGYRFYNDILLSSHPPDLSQSHLSIVPGLSRSLSDYAIYTSLHPHISPL